MREFTLASYNQFSIQVLILGAYIDDEGDPAMTL